MNAEEKAKIIVSQCLLGSTKFNGEIDREALGSLLQQALTNAYRQGQESVLARLPSEKDARINSEDNSFDAGFVAGACWVMASVRGEK